MNKKILLAAIAALILLSGCLQPSEPGRCSDGVCNTNENRNNCPEDCEEPASTSEGSPFGILTAFYPPKSAFTGGRPSYEWNFSENDDPPFSTAMDIGIKWDRATHPILDWSFVQKDTEDIRNGKYDWSVSDNYIKKVPAELNLLITLNVGDIGLKPGTWQFKNGQFKTQYVEFVKRAVERYDGDGIDDMPGLKSPVKFWQIENEPVSRWAETYGPNLDWQGYSGLVRVTYEAVKVADNGATVLSGGMLDVPQMRETVFNEFWVPVIEELNGQYIDVFDFHWFSRWNNSYALYKDIRDTLNKNGFTNTDTWITENGASSQDGETVQAIDLVKRFIYPLSYGVKKVFWAWALVEGWPPFTCDSMFDYTGLIYNGFCPGDKGYGVKKLSYYTYKLMVEKLEGSDWNNIEIISESDGIYIYKFNNQGKPIWVAWNEGPKQEITISSIGSSHVKITEAVPNAETGTELNENDYPDFFETTTLPVSKSMTVSLTLGNIPVFVEEI